jgi:hypothetical protein
MTIIKVNYPTSEEYKATTRLRGEFLTVVLNTKASATLIQAKDKTIPFWNRMSPPC